MVSDFTLERDLFRKPVSTFRDHALDHQPPPREAAHRPEHSPADVRHTPLPLLPTNRPLPLAERPPSATVTWIAPLGATEPPTL
jgi:hypothetical protein